MRSRALPADFDMTQTLHSPFGAQPPTMGSQIPSPGSYGSYGDDGGARPLSLDTLRRVPEYETYGQQYSSPTGITPALGSFAFTPPQSATETMSPASAASNVSSYGFQAQESPRRQPHGLAMGAQPGYSMHHPHIPRLHLQDRFARPLGESVGSPLRTSISYSGLHQSGNSQSQHQERAASSPDQPSAVPERPQQHRSLTGPSGGTSAPYGLGFSCKHTSTVCDCSPANGLLDATPYPNIEQHQKPPSSHNTGNLPPTALPHYRRDSDHIAGPPIATYAQYHPPPYAQSQVPQYPSYGGQYADQGFSHPYHQHGAPPPPPPQSTSTPGSHPGPQLTPVPSQPHHFVGLGGSSDQGAEEGDNSEGGVPLPPSY